MKEEKNWLHIFFSLGGGFLSGGTILNFHHLLHYYKVKAERPYSSVSTLYNS